MERGKLNEAEEREKFEHFLFEMDDALEPFVAEAARAGFQLDYKPESLDRLEQFYLSRNPAGTAKEQLIQNAARYFGEVVRRNYGGKWQLEIENPKHLYYGLPVVSGYAPSKVKLSPHQTFRMFTKGKPPGFLRQVISSQLSPKELNLEPET